MRLISLFNDLHICVSALLLLMLGVANLSAGLVVRTLLPFLCWVTVRLFYCDNTKHTTSVEMEY